MDRKLQNRMKVMKTSTIKSLIIINLSALMVGVLGIMQPLSSASGVKLAATEKRAPATVYHACKKAEWEVAQQQGSYQASQNNMIHLATWKQLPKVLKKFFKGQDDLVLLEINYSSIKDRTKWEVGSTQSPHYYGDLPISSVIKAHTLPMQRDGSHIIPTNIYQ